MKSLWLENQQAEHLSFCLLNFEYFLIFFFTTTGGMWGTAREEQEKASYYLDHIDHDYDDEGHDDGS